MQTDECIRIIQQHTSTEKQKIITSILVKEKSFPENKKLLYEESLVAQLRGKVF